MGRQIRWADRFVQFQFNFEGVGAGVLSFSISKQKMNGLFGRMSPKNFVWCKTGLDAGASVDWNCQILQCHYTHAYEFCSR